MHVISMRSSDKPDLKAGEQGPAGALSRFFGGRKAGWLLPLGVAAVLVSCGTVDRTIVAPPMLIPGAEYIGTEECDMCHEEIVQEFKFSSHANLMAPGDNALPAGCESCHGPGSVHSDDAGGRGNIINPKNDPRICFNCHLDVRGSFGLPSHHPVAENRLSCGDCHPPHGGSALPGGGSISALAENEACLKCHPSQRGPFVFEHEAMRDGCTTCHQPHGSVNDKLLKARNASLCINCHFQQQTASGAVLIGGQDHSLFLSRGTCWSSGCHEAVHGSRVNSSLRY